MPELSIHKFQVFQDGLKIKKHKNIELNAVNSKMGAWFLLDDIHCLFLEAKYPNFMLWWYEQFWIFSVIVKSQMHFRRIPDCLLKLSHWKCSQFYPPTKKQQPSALPLPCLPCSDLGQHWNFSLFLLWTDCSYFRCKLDCVTSCTHSCMDRFFFFLLFFSILQKWTWKRDACVHLGCVTVCLWVEPSGCGIFHGNCFSCWLKDLF